MLSSTPPHPPYYYYSYYYSSYYYYYYYYYYYSQPVCLLGFGWSEKAVTDYSSGGLWSDQIGDFVKEVVQGPAGAPAAAAAAAAAAATTGSTEPVVLAGNSLVSRGFGANREREGCGMAITTNSTTHPPPRQSHRNLNPRVAMQAWLQQRATQSWCVA